MPKSSDIIIRSYPSFTPEQARDARARAWRFVLDCWEQKKAAGEDCGEVHTVKEPEDDSRDRTQPQR